MRPIRIPCNPLRFTDRVFRRTLISFVQKTGPSHPRTDAGQVHTKVLNFLGSFRGFMLYARSLATASAGVSDQPHRMLDKNPPLPISETLNDGRSQQWTTLDSEFLRC